jgi:hypothetical protein
MSVVVKVEGITDTNFFEIQTWCSSYYTQLGVFIGLKLHIHHRNYMFAQSGKHCELICAVTYSFASLDGLLMLYFSIV